MSADPVAGCVLVHGVDHGHGIVPVHERGHDHGRGHAHDDVHVTISVSDTPEITEPRGDGLNVSVSEQVECVPGRLSDLAMIRTASSSS